MDDKSVSQHFKNETVHNTGLQYKRLLVCSQNNKVHIFLGPLLKLLQIAIILTIH